MVSRGKVLEDVLGLEQRWSRGHKARGQGHKKNPRPRTQKIPRSRTSFPRTELLEVKDRGHRRKRSPKKIGLQKYFSKEKVFARQRHCRMKDLKSLLPVCTQSGFCKGRGLKLIVEKCKYLTLETC